MTRELGKKRQQRTDVTCPESGRRLDGEESGRRVRNVRGEGPAKRDAATVERRAEGVQGRRQGEMVSLDQAGVTTKLNAETLSGVTIKPKSGCRS